MEHKSRESKDPWSNRKFGLGPQNEAGQRLTEFYQKNILVITSILFQQHIRILYTWPSPKIVNTEIRLIIFFAAEDGEALYSQQNLELIVAELMSSVLKIQAQLKKVGKTTRPFSYDLNQITYDYAVEVMNRFKGLDLADRMSEELWMEVCNIVQEAVNKIIPKKNKGKKAKRLSEKALQTVEKRKVKQKGEKERYTQLNAEFQRVTSRDKKTFFNE